jgi:hypothetical protein
LILTKNPSFRSSTGWARAVLPKSIPRLQWAVNEMKNDIVEKLLKEWGADKALNGKNYPLAVLTALGYKTGHRWASHQEKGDLLSLFEEFYKDWTNNELTGERFKQLHEKLDPASIIAQTPDFINQAIDDPSVAEAMLENFHLFEKGIVWGLMSVIRKIIAEGKST